MVQPDLPDDHRPILARIQQRLFDLGADLADPSGGHRIGADEVSWCASEVDRFAAGQEALDSFVLPGGGHAAAHLQACRTSARRAERTVVALIEADDDLTDATCYLNRLSDLFFVLARDASTDEVGWVPLPDRLAEQRPAERSASPHLRRSPRPR